ncbi:MAG: 50S ribosomal protein L31e [Nitrosopumilaceae archaeon]
MSEETVERVYTINLGKVLLSPNNQRAKRAINMIREFAIRHMKSEIVKMEEDVSHLVWQRGIRHPPRKIRVKLTKDDDGAILISKYQEEKPAEKIEAKLEEPKPAQSEPVTEKESETKKEPKQKQDKPKKETKSEKNKEKTKTKSDSKRKKK